MKLITQKLSEENCMLILELILIRRVALDLSTQLKNTRCSLHVTLLNSARNFNLFIFSRYLFVSKSNFEIAFNFNVLII